ncbi:MAG: glycine C-acetyltransferase [Hyphomicrobiales bacterium]|nr:glycine C-acetyltransferase [Hyphomicrobiales bacterium]
MLDRLRADLEGLRRDGFEKTEVPLNSPQGSHVVLGTKIGADIINMCANNYLGLANHPAILAAAKDAIDRFGFGMASVRFICGTNGLQLDLETRLSNYLKTEGTILYSSCFDANTGLFETLLDERDAIVSDALNHASIIDGIRLSKAKRFRFAHNDMAALEAMLDRAAGARTILIVTDGVFSMDGTIANLPAICALAERSKALVMVDDSHAVGFVGPGGRGTPALYEIADKIDIVSGTLGKALGGASGGYISGRREVVDWLRQASRPYLFSNALMPAICAASICAIDMAETASDLRQNLSRRVMQLRTGLSELGLEVGGIDHPIVPIITGDAQAAKDLAVHLFMNDILATPFAYPIVPKGAARVRLQVSASHSERDIERVVSSFASYIGVGKHSPTH